MQAVDEVLACGHRLSVHRGGFVLVDDGNGDLVETAIRVPVGRQVDDTVEQWDQQQEDERDARHEPPETLEFIPGQGEGLEAGFRHRDSPD